MLYHSHQTQQELYGSYLGQDHFSPEINSLEIKLHKINFFKCLSYFKRFIYIVKNFANYKLKGSSVHPGLLTLTSDTIVRVLITYSQTNSPPKNPSFFLHKLQVCEVPKTTLSFDNSSLIIDFQNSSESSYTHGCGLVQRKNTDKTQPRDG